VEGVQAEGTAKQQFSEAVKLNQAKNHLRKKIVPRHDNINGSLVRLTLWHKTTPIFYLEGISLHCGQDQLS
jgi:hypothetical protein